MSRHTERLARASAEAGRQGFDAIVVAPSADLAYLTGYDPMPFERPTLLVLRPQAEPVMLVPELERPLALGSPVGSAIELVGWRDGVDAYEEAARLLPSAGGSRWGTGSGPRTSSVCRTPSRGRPSRPGSIVIAQLRR